MPEVKFDVKYGLQYLEKQLNFGIPVCMNLNFDICTLQSPILIPEQLSKYFTCERGKMNLITDLICNFPSSIIN